MTQNIFSQISGYVPPEHNGRLYQKVKSRLDVGVAEQQKLINAVSAMVIRDKLVPPGHMRIHPADSELPGIPANRMIIRYQGSDPCTIHQHALGQLAAKVNVPMAYVNHLAQGEPWKRELLGHILTESFQKTHFSDRGGSPRFLHRIVGNELRGFLSKRYNRNLASAPLLRAFLSATQEVNAFPMEATVTDVKLALKCYLPYVFEPVDGQYVCLGVEWANSDFGAGRLQVSLTMWLPQGNRFTVLDQALSRVHIGSVIEEADIELSEETSSKEAEAQALAIRDSVKTQLAVESIEKVLKAIELAHNEAVPWHRIRGNLAKYLGKKEIEDLHNALKMEILDLPPVPKVDGEIQPTKWWASNALSWLASKESDPEKRLELQHAAGSFIEMK